MILHGHQYARPFVPTSMPYTTLCGSYVCKILQIMVGAMCTLLIFACLPTMSISVPLVDLAEAPTTNKERQALETLQCQYGGVIGELMWDRSTCHPHMITCSPARPSLSPPLSVMALYLRSPGCAAKSMIFLLPSVCTRIYADHRCRTPLTWSFLPDFGIAALGERNSTTIREMLLVYYSNDYKIHKRNGSSSFSPHDIESTETTDTPQVVERLAPLVA